MDHTAQKIIPGTEAEYIYTVLAGFLSLEVDWVPLNDYDEFDACLNNGTVDILGITYMLDKEYLDQWIASPLYIWDALMVIGKETIVDKNEGGFMLFKVFHPYVWLVMLICTMLLYFMGRIPYISQQKYFVINAVWLLLLAILMEVYANILSIDLVQPTFKSITRFTTADEMADLLVDKKCRLVIDSVYEGEYEFDHWLVNPNQSLHLPFFQKMKKAFEINAPLYVDGGRDAIADWVLKKTTSKKCYIGVDYSSVQTWYNSRYCNLQFISFPKYINTAGYVYYHNSPELGALLDTVMVADAFSLYHGYSDYLMKKYYSLLYKPDCAVSRAKVQQLSLSKMLDSFVILLAAVGIVVLIFLAEIIVKKADRRLGLNLDEKMEQLEEMVARPMSQMSQNLNTFFVTRDFVETPEPDRSVDRTVEIWDQRIKDTKKYSFVHKYSIQNET